MRPGRVVVLNGVPRSGKSSIAAEVMVRLAGQWVNVGVDSVMAATPEHLQPGIGLRPGGERPDLEPYVAESYTALFAEIAVHARAGTNVVVDVGIHDGYTQPLGVLQRLYDCLDGVTMHLVGVHCPLAVLRDRRAASGYPSWSEGDEVPPAVLRWQHAVHADVHYDLELDTSELSPTEATARIGDLCTPQGSAQFDRLDSARLDSHDG